MKLALLRQLSLGIFAAIAVVFFCPAAHDAASACTRTLYVGADNTVITGRNMDWEEDMGSNLWVFPAGMKRDGAAGPRSVASPEEPNIASTLWRTVSDHKNLVYYFDSATLPDTFWVTLSKLDLKPGAPVKKLTIAGGAVFAGDVSALFVRAEPFKFLPAQAP